jgi:hypothetical protein
MVREHEHLQALATRLGYPRQLQAHEGSTAQQLNRSLEQLRGWWVERCLRPSRRLFRSPFYSQRKPMPLGQEALYTYERSLWPVPLETCSVPSGWQAERAVCRNRQAAYWTALVTLRDLAETAVHVRSWNISAALPNLLQSARWQWSQAFSQTTLHSSLEGGRGDLFLLGADGWDMEEWLQAWEARPSGSAPTLLLDVTWAPQFDWDNLLRRLEHDPPPLLIQLRGWQQWDSLGLPLCLPGSATFYAPAQPGMSAVAMAGELARRARSVLGTALTLPELSQWSCGFPDAHPYVKRVLQNAEQVPEVGTGPADWDDFRSRAAGLGVLEGEAYGGLAHRFWRDHAGTLRVAAGWRDPHTLLELLAGGGRRGRLPTRASLPPPVWPAERHRLLRVADATPPAGLAVLEQRLLGYDESPPGWTLVPLLFRSAMAALTAVWTVLEALSQPTLQRPLRVATLGRYFESKFLEQLVQGGGVLQLTGLSQADVVFAESVDYDWELAPLRFEPLREVRALVLDTTLSGQRLGIARVRRELPELQYAVRVFSALKLDQQGLELENCGGVLIGAPAPLAEQLAAALRVVRRETGGEHGDTELRRLSPPLVLHADLARSHAEQVFANNAALAGRLRRCSGGILDRVAHPSGGDSPWAVAPFVVLHLSDDSVERHRLLAGVIRREARARRLPLRRGASFGFVDHRYEFIIPVLRENRALFKIAMGARTDIQPVLEMLAELFRFTHWSDLERRYPDVEPVSAAADWASPSERMLEFLAGSE